MSHGVHEGCVYILGIMSNLMDRLANIQSAATGQWQHLKHKFSRKQECTLATSGTKPTNSQPTRSASLGSTHLTTKPHPKLIHHAWPTWNHFLWTVPKTLNAAQPEILPSSAGGLHAGAAAWVLRQRLAPGADTDTWSGTVQGGALCLSGMLQCRCCDYNADLSR